MATINICSIVDDFATYDNSIIWATASEAGLKLPCIQEREDPTEGVVGKDAVSRSRNPLSPPAIFDT
jgi:hypothetical protein